GGQYQKQLPLNPELMRPRGAAAKDKDAGTLDKSRGKVLRLPSARDFAKPVPPQNNDTPPSANENPAEGASSKKRSGGPKP
ncbi:MAG: hypothetical protein Q8K65_04120, partial [Alphaproteobacteria bacterium]|nr:hypothetical protein [Alphaproteobacteria bacterium]